MSTEKTTQLALGCSNAGTAGEYVVAKEYGNRFGHTTRMDINAADVLTAADNAALGSGHLLYTFPAGHILIHSVIMTMNIKALGSTDIADAAAEFGLGTVIATGAIATLGAGDPTMEDIFGPIVLTDTAGTEQVSSNAGDFDILTAAAHTVHFNVAGTWIDHSLADSLMDLDATIVMNWSVLV